MKRNNHFIFFPLLILVLASCETDFDYKPNIVEEVYFIDGMISNLSSRNYVVVNKLNTSGEMVPVQGAEILITDTYGQRVTMLESKPGYYVLPDFRAFPGYTYHVKIDVDGKEFIASSKTFRSNQRFKITTSPSSGGKLNLFYDYNSSLKADEFYRVALIINGERFDNKEWLHVRHITQGSKIFGIAQNLDLEINDTVEVEIQSLPYEAYQFYLDLLIYYAEQDNESLFSPSPVFPQGNLSNGAEGVFRVSHIVSKKIIIDDDTGLAD